MTATGWAKDVLDFWFGELTPKQWYTKDDAVDRTIVERFGALHETIAATDNAELAASREKALAAIIVLDQFARNMFRGSAKSFAGDAKARALANAVLERSPPPVMFQHGFRVLLLCRPIGDDEEITRQQIQLPGARVRLIHDD